METTLIYNNRLRSPLARFVGADAIVVASQTFDPAIYIMVYCAEVSFPANVLAEDRGGLFLFPIGDGQYSLQLCYLFYTNEQNAIAWSVTFNPGFFEQFPHAVVFENQPFRFDQVTEIDFPVCAQSLHLLEQCRPVSGPNLFSGLLQQTQAAMGLLSRALQCIAVTSEVCQVPACRFLAFDTEREKIVQACLLIAQNEGRPFTIRELARSVAINECYLKRGFKAITGKTIHDYQQEIRISKAKELLQVNRYSVTDVANILGYSSISHFSTAFKRVTGMKPCELLS